jgi:hypothetical protein
VIVLVIIPSSQPRCGSAIGLVAIMFSLALFTVQDLWVLVTGAPYALHGLRGGWYLLWAAIATLFSATTVFIWRPGLPRIVIGLFSISMTSHILEQFVGLSAQELKLVALCRVFVAVALILLVLRYRARGDTPGQSKDFLGLSKKAANRTRDGP